MRIVFFVWFLGNLASAVFLVACKYVSDSTLTALLLGAVGAEIVVLSVLYPAAVRTWQVTRYACVTVAVLMYFGTSELSLLWHVAPILSLIAVTLTAWTLVVDRDIRRHPEDGGRFA